MAAATYETVFIAEPEIPTEQVEQLHTKLKQIVGDHKGSVTAEDRWGRRRLAFPIQGFREGFYSVITFTAEPTIVSALEHFYNVTDTIIRHIVIRQIKRNKTFPPRRERPAGAAEHRPYAGRSGSYGGRPRSDSGVRPSAPGAATAPAAEKSEPPASPTPTDTGGNPS